MSSGSSIGSGSGSGCLMGACTGMMGGALLIGSSGADSGEYMLGAAAIWISLLGSGLERCEKWLTVCLFICLVVCSFVWLFICFSVCLFVHLFVVVVVVVVTSRSSAAPGINTLIIIIRG